MGKPIKFRIKAPRIKIVSRCMFCGKNIPSGAIICSACRRRPERMLR